MTTLGNQSRGLATSRLVALFGALVVTGLAFGIGLVVGTAPLWGTLAVLAALALVFCLARPAAATYVVIAILYSNAAGVAVREHGLPTFVALAFPLLLALPLADHLLLRRKPVVITGALPFLFGYLLIQVIAALAARDPAEATDSLINFLISGFGLYLVLTNVVRSFGGLRLAVWTVLAVAAGMGALSAFQAVSGTYASDYWGFSTVDLPGQDTEQLVASLSGTPRHEGPIGETNRYGQVMLVLLPIGAMLALGERRPLLRAVAVLLTLLILAGMASSFSRGAALGLGVVLAVAMLFRYVKPVHLAMLLLTLVVMLVAFPRYGERLIELQGLMSLDRTAAIDEAGGGTGNLRGRATSTLAALYVWADHPLVGVGRGQFSQYYEEYAGAVAEDDEAGFEARVNIGQTREAHNLFTSVLAETGALGFACFLAIFLVTLMGLNRARRRWQAERPDVAYLAMGFFLALIAYLVSGMALHLSYERYLWFLLALAGTAAYLANRGDPLRDFEVGQAPGRREPLVRRALPQRA